MASDEPEVTTVTSKGQITIPSSIREEFGLEQGTKLMLVPTEYGLVLKKVDLPSVEEFQKRVEQRADAIDVSPEEVSQLVHEARGNDE
jgi:AbrB family looped-hinge helix DNA binding protein